MKHAQLILVGSVEMAGLAQSCIACQTKQQHNNKTKHKFKLCQDDVGGFPVWILVYQ